MTAERVQAKLDNFRDAASRLRVMTDLKTSEGHRFNQLAEDYRKGTRGIKSRLRGELRQCWYQYRAAMRCEVDLRTLYEQAFTDLMQTLMSLGQALGERLPEQFENPEPGKPLL